MKTKLFFLGILTHAALFSQNTVCLTIENNPNANDPAMNAEKHSIARWPLNSEVMSSVYSAAKTLGLLG